jgi:predicted dehydrogenase
MAPFRVGIIGCGLIGNKRARFIKDDPFTSICCASDIIISNAQALIKEHANCKATAYQDWRDMLDKEDLDIVIVATPNKFLGEISSRAAEKDSHILCEKPLGRNTKEAQEILNAVKNKNVVLKTGFNHRHHPAIFKAHELIERGALGQTYYARCVYGHGGRPGYEREWRASREICGGGELLDQGVHVADLFRWFLGDFEEAFGTLSTYYWDMEVEDNAFALFKTVKGQTASMHTSWTQWKNRFTFEIYGEAGYLIVEGLGGSYGTETLHIGKRKLADDSNQLMTNNVAPHYAGGAPDEEVIEFPGPDISWRSEWKEFTAAIIEKRKPLGNGSDGLEANRMIEAIYRSTQENRPVKIKEIK